MSRIEGRDIYLVPITIGDTSLIVRWRNNPRVMRNFRFDKPFEKNLHEKWLNDNVRTGKAIQYIVYIKSSDQPIGSVYFRDIDNNNHTAEFGIFIGEDSACGHGYGEEATKLFTDYGVSVQRFQRIILRVFEDNKHAIRCYERAGYTLIDDGGEDITNKYGVLRHMIHMNLVIKK